VGLGLGPSLPREMETTTEKLMMIVESEAIVCAGGKPGWLDVYIYIYTLYMYIDENQSMRRDEYCRPEMAINKS
jgi:hypothetical protein